MKISTRGRYALRVMIDLGTNLNKGYISLKDISERQEISMKYLETIIQILNKASFVESSRGKNGGYQLTKPLKDYTVEQILELTDGRLAPVACLECPTNDCPRKEVCSTLAFWTGLDKVIHDYLKSVSLEDLVNNNKNIESLFI